MDKILVLRGGALGDFIVTLPALASLRERWPRARIELAGNATAGKLALSRGVIDAVHSQHERRWAGLFADAPLAPDFARWLAAFDLVLNFWPDPDGELRRRFPFHDRQRFASASPTPERAPAAAHYLEPLGQFGIVPRTFFLPLAPLPSDVLRVDAGYRAQATTGDGFSPSRLRDCVAIHPGSGSPRKNWPLQKWQELIEKLAPAPVSLVLGEAEMERLGEKGASSFSTAGGRQCCALINRPLEELVEHFAGCRLFLGHDSGISHLAAACGARCVLLFGPTDAAVWAPPAPNVRVLRSDLNLLTVEAVSQVVAEALAGQT
jgi:heptosyltransferase III